MITLLLDSSSRVMHIGLARNRKLFASHVEEAFQTQSELFTDRINKLLVVNNTKPSEINEIVVTYGPGSFTGVRIAVTIAKVMAFALNVPLYRVSSLALFAHASKPSICVLDARNGRSFAAIYEQNTLISEDTIMLNSDILDLSNRKEYVIAGETKHLALTSTPYDPFTNMLNLINEENLIEDIKAFKPLYLKG